MPHKADTTVICQCGAMVCKYYMPKHLRTLKHERDMIGREHIEIADTYVYTYVYITQQPIYVCIYVCMYIRMYVCMYVCMYVYITQQPIYVCMYVCM